MVSVANMPVKIKLSLKISNRFLKYFEFTQRVAYRKCICLRVNGTIIIEDFIELAIMVNLSMSKWEEMKRAYSWEAVQLSSKKIAY